MGRSAAAIRALTPDATAKMFNRCVATGAPRHGHAAGAVMATLALQEEGEEAATTMLS